MPRLGGGSGPLFLTFSLREKVPGRADEGMLVKTSKAFPSTDPAGHLLPEGEGIKRQRLHGSNHWQSCGRAWGSPVG